MKDLDLRLEVVSKSCQPLCDISRKPVEIESSFQLKMAYGLSNGHVTDDVTWPCNASITLP